MKKDKLMRVCNRFNVINFDRSSKIVLFSDCHRGDGSYKDSLYANINIYLTALRHYYNSGYTYIELGDGDELWKFKDLSSIVDAHRDEYKILEAFKRDKRIYMIWGNHDKIKSKKYFKRYIEKYKNRNNLMYDFYNDLNIYEGLLLNYNNIKEYFLFHGHQFDFACDELAPLTKFLVRYVWGFLNGFLSFKEITNPAKYDNKRLKIDTKAALWSKINKKNIIIGHTHNSIFPNEENGYINVGAAVLPYSITCIEIDGGIMALYKWVITSINGGFLVVKKECLGKPKLIK